MSDPQYISYDQISLAVKKINQFLLKSEGGILLRVKVNKKNDVEHIDFCGLEEAISQGISFDGLVSKA